MTFLPRSTIRIEVEEISEGPLYKDAELQIVLHGYKMLGYGHRAMNMSTPARSRRDTGYFNFCNICGAPLDADYFDVVQLSACACERRPGSRAGAPRAAFAVLRRAALFRPVRRAGRTDSRQVLSETPGYEWVILCNNQPRAPYLPTSLILSAWGLNAFPVNLRLEEGCVVRFVVRQGHASARRRRSITLSQVGGRLMGRSWYNAELRRRARAPVRDGHAMYLSTGASTEAGLGKADGCAANAVLKGTLCGFDSTNSKSVTAVYVPASAPTTDPVTILVWIHGDIIPCGDEGNDAISYVKSSTFPLARQISESKLPYVLAVPSMKWNSGRNKESHALGSPKTMNAFVEEVRTGLTNAGWANAPALGRLILAGHSRAYVVLNALAGAVADPQSSLGALGKLTDVWLVDTTYGKKNAKFHCGKWIAWADRARQGAELRLAARAVSQGERHGGRGRVHTRRRAQGPAPQRPGRQLPFALQSAARPGACAARRQQARQGAIQSAALTAMYVPTTRGFEERRLPPAFTPADYRWGTAADRESHGLGQTPPPQVTAGEFGKALASIDPPAVVTTLLRLSKTFMDIAATLDKRYVYLWHPTENRHRRLVTSDNGIVTTGDFAGRRVLDVKKNPAGSWFQPFEDPDNTGYYDVIWIEKPGQREIGSWIEIIAHEATHACHLATRTSAMPAKLADFVKASIAEEIETRRIEALVLKEIGKTTAGKRELAGFVPSTGSTDAHEVERDFFPSQLRRTYLEHFVLSKLARDAIKREQFERPGPQGEGCRGRSPALQSVAVSQILVGLRQVALLATGDPLPLGATARDPRIELRCLPAREGNPRARACQCVFWRALALHAATGEERRFDDEAAVTRREAMTEGPNHVLARVSSPGPGRVALRSGTLCTQDDVKGRVEAALLLRQRQQDARRLQLS